MIGLVARVGRLARLGSRLRRDARGVALVEFAITAPILLLLFIGGFQLLDAISAYRKVTTTVRAMADLTTQSSSLTSGQADTILAASRQVMAPYAVTPAALRISEIQINGLGVPSVVWSRPLNTTAYAVGTYINVPVNMRVANTYLVLSEITYTYNPQLASAMVGSFPFKEQLLMSPRNSDSIPCTGC